jgi:hypothetical protein
LQFIEFHLGTLQAGAVAGKGKRARCSMVQILTDTLKQHGSAAVSAEESIAISVISVPIRTAVAWAVVIALKAAVIARCRATVLAGRVITPHHTEGIFGSATLRIFNPNYCGTAISGFGQQVLMAAAIQPGESEVGWILRHG